MIFCSHFSVLFVFLRFTGGLVVVLFDVLVGLLFIVIFGVRRSFVGLVFLSCFSQLLPLELDVVKREFV